MNVRDHADHRLVASLAEQYVGTLRSCLDGATRVALLDFPHHENVGDSAIWLGEREALRRLGCEVVHVGELGRHDVDGLRRRLGDGVVLLHGGGNLGNLWPQHQEFRERVLTDFRHVRVILLAQSMQVTDAAVPERMARCFEAHPDLTILARDARTLELARSLWATRTVLCPDAAFLLDLEAKAPAVAGPLWLLRTDHERATEPGMATEDWLHTRRRWSPGRWAESGLEAVLQAATILERRTGRARQWLLPRIYDRYASHNIRRGVRLLADRPIVVTDRLHGHILCLLLGVPHVLLDDAHGKVRAFSDTWTSGSTLATWAGSPAHAASLVEGLTAA